MIAPPPASSRPESFPPDGTPPARYGMRNAWYRTDASRGYSHGDGTARGSVFPDPLVRHDDTGDTLWLEHVRAHDGGGDLFWLMWYDRDGYPRLRNSAVMGPRDLAILLRGLGRNPGRSLPGGNALDADTAPMGDKGGTSR
ncbi:hypothetical protein [Novacetimonas pomaceti]|uniref:hypothetical protein n=1 Tax=Novacetimonas pomaceti TaxID=2021998 RepID=UPI001EF11E8B|nr:hypothetical protein [Novacetimonas pomaceti]